MGTPLFLADALTLDSTSNRGDCGFPATPFGVAIPATKVMVGSAPLMMIPDGTVGTTVPGVGALACGAIARTAKVTVNGGNGYVVIEDKVPCLAPNRAGGGGDVAKGPNASPVDRNLTGPCFQNRIVIGSGGSYVPPEFTE